MKSRIKLIENSISEDSEIILWEFLKLIEQFTWKSHEDKSCFKAHKKWKHVEWSKNLKVNTKDVYNNPVLLRKDERQIINSHKHLAIEINKIELEIEIYYSKEGHKYFKLSDFYNWYKCEYSLSNKEEKTDTIIQNYGIESLINIY